VRAWQVVRHGAPDEAMALGDAPQPAGGGVVVEVVACGLNFADSLLCAGTYQERPALPFTPGLEVAGRVVAGDGWHPGDTVVGLTALPHGGLADRAVLHPSACLPLPEGFHPLTAAGMLITEQSAWFALHRRGRLAPGEVVLVHAGAGGVGSATIQLARAAGATVIATAGGATKVARCLELGAHHALDHRTDDVVEVVKDLTGGRGVDVVVDPVGGETFAASTKVVAWEGRIVVVGSASGIPGEVRANHVLVKNYDVVGLHWPRYRLERPELLGEAHDALVALHQQGALHTDVSEVVPFGGAADAVARLAAGRTTGKLVVQVAP
jgi:NADPH:quinone reductase